MRLARTLGAVALGCLVAQGATAAGSESQNDLRDFRIGMELSELPEMGYGNFTCADGDADARVELDSWADYTRCPANEDGLHEVRFEYTATRVEFVKANDKWEGTRVFGHPSLVSLLMDDTGTVQKIRIETNPDARRYMRKKAFLLGQRSKFHFSPSTWECEEMEPSEGEAPVGGIFIKERCVNRFDDRVVRMEVDLFRTPDQGLEDFTNATRIEISGAE